MGAPGKGLLRMCERVIGSMRRECLDYMIPLTESHLNQILKSWTVYYNQTRPHMALGPGIPDRKSKLPTFFNDERHRIRENVRVMANEILRGLHHDYELVPC